MFQPELVFSIRYLEIEYSSADFLHCACKNALFYFLIGMKLVKSPWCSKHKIPSAYNFCVTSLIFHRIWTCSRRLLTYIMRWRILFTKIPGPVPYEINGSHRLPWGSTWSRGSQVGNCVREGNGYVEKERQMVWCGRITVRHTHTHTQLLTENLTSRGTHEKELERDRVGEQMLSSQWAEVYFRDCRVFQCTTG